MGSCLGKCRTTKENKCHGVENDVYFNTESIEFDCLVGNTEDLVKKSYKPKGEEISLELDEDGWMRSDLKSKHLENCTTEMDGHRTESISNACPLNVFALEELQDVTSPSTPHSSIDLEWEPEGLILPEVPVGDAVAGEKDNPLSAVCTSSLSVPWSRMSSPNSLEWDPCEEEHRVEGGSSANYSEDAETEQLISEIEQLTSRALRETGAVWNGCLR